MTITKKRVRELIDEYSSMFKEVLEIKSNISFTVFNSNSLKYKKLKLSEGQEKGISFINSMSDADIIIFYNHHKTERDLVGTILHELLHVRIYKLSSLCTINIMQAYEVEEELVADLEEFFMQLIWDKKL